MKKILLLIFLLCLGRAYAQRPGGYYNGRVNDNNPTRVNNYYNNTIDNTNYDQVHLVDSSQQITADILPYKNDPKIKNDRYYYWYLDKVIHSTQGGYSGQLLNGHYIAFYPDKNLKEEGDFKTGLKDGEWKTWNRNGDLTSVTNWDDGIQEPGNGRPFWKKIPFVNKKDKSQPGGQSSGSN